MPAMKVEKKINEEKLFRRELSLLVVRGKMLLQ